MSSIESLAYRAHPAQGSNVPDQLIMTVVGLKIGQAKVLAQKATRYAKQGAPKLTGQSSSRFEAVWGEEYFGVRWYDSYVWYQDKGIAPFTMRRLAGKTIPMWIDDPTGQVARENPKSKTRITMTGRKQTLLFRRAAKMGARKWVTKMVGGVATRVNVPASYPGAPGRIAGRVPGKPNTPTGYRGGAIMKGNQGVRWRHPGLQDREYLEYGLLRAVYEAGLVPGEMFAVGGTAERKIEFPRR